jgi:hypothetical protein
MFPPNNAVWATRFSVQGVPVDVVWVRGGTRVYYPIVADWIEEEIRVTRCKPRAWSRRRRQDRAS